MSINILMSIYIVGNDHTASDRKHIRCPGVNVTKGQAGALYFGNLDRQRGPVSSNRGRGWTNEPTDRRGEAHTVERRKDGGLTRVIPYSK